MTGKVIKALEESGQRDNTIVIFTSDHGYHLGEHDLWSKASIHEESALVPHIICVPGKRPALCNSLVELLDLYPTVSSLCGLEIPDNIQGRNTAPMLDDSKAKVRDAVLCSGKGRLYRDNRWALLDYTKPGELYDMENAPKQYTNLFDQHEYAETVSGLKQKLKAKLDEISNNDLHK